MGKKQGKKGHKRDKNRSIDLRRPWLSSAKKEQKKEGGRPLSAQSVRSRKGGKGESLKGEENYYRRFCLSSIAWGDFLLFPFGGGAKEIERGGLARLMTSHL